MNQSALNGMIRKHKEHVIWVAVFLVLAVFVTALVFGTLKRSVQAQTYTKRVFACSYAQEGAEPVAHQHNDDCYENGELICTLPERELHIHGDECYAEEKVLVCTLEESEGHVHTDACYTEEPVLVCGQEEDLGHAHSDACYTEEQVLVCGLEENDGHVHSAENGCYTRVQGELICTNEDPEHVHNDDCYAWEEVLTCEIPEGEGAHHHDEQCYETQRILSCGQEEREPGHIHSEECYETQRVLSCGKEEGEGAHTHDDTCYEIHKVLICDKEEVKTEHVHTVDCFQVVDMSPEEIHALHMSELPESDPTADVESPDVWESRFASVPLSGHWDRDLLKIAETQLGYTESQRNFEAVPDEYGDGYTLKGWTRYGAWYGIPYGDWCAMFISFCLNYADIPESAVPFDCATTTWIDSLSARGMYAPAGSYDPKPGDLIFFDWEGDGLSDHVGIVWAVNPGSITTIEGNHTISVELFDYDLSDGHIQGYGILPENPYLPTSEDDSREAETAETAGTESNAENADDNSVSDSDPDDDQEDAPTADASTEDANPDESASSNAEPIVNMPPFKESRLVSGIRVTIEADEGAFPEGTTVEIKAIEDDGLAEQVAPVVNGKVVQIQAVDITFFDAEGNEIEPLIPIRVTMRPNNETDEADGVEVVHVDNEGNVNAVTPDEAIAQPDKGAAFDADSFSPYVLVYVLKFDYPVNGKTYESELAGGEDLSLSNLLVQLGVCGEEEVSEFVSKIISVTASDPEALRVAENEGVWTIRPMKESEGELSLAIEMLDGAKFSVQVQAIGKTEVSSDDNNTVITAVNDLYLPENAVAEIAVLTEEESTDAIAAVEKAVEQDTTEAATSPDAGAESETPTVSQVAYQVFSISLDGVEYSKYEDGFQVSLTLPEGITGKDFEIYHIDDEGNAQKLELTTDAHNLTEETQLVSAVSFVTPSFSDFVIRYTVDFHYKVNGNYYEFSFTGGSFVSLEQLLELLQIPYEPEPELEPVPAAEPVMQETGSGETGSMDIEIADFSFTSDSTDMEESSQSADSSIAAESVNNETRVVYTDLSGIAVSDVTRDFTANIESVTFTTPELIWVDKVVEQTTVGALKEANGLAPQYSSELTDEQIAEIDTQTVTAGDWALISLKPFKSEESLIITMNSGRIYKIRVTDEQKPFAVRITLDASAQADISADDNYYVFVKANYSDSDPRYQFAPLIITQTERDQHYVGFAFDEWLDNNGNTFNQNNGAKNTSYTGHETSIEVKIMQYGSSNLLNNLNQATVCTEGCAVKNYKVSYAANPQNSSDSTDPVQYFDYINLTTIDAEGEYTYASILGPNMYYGIVADHLYHENHLQTNFAVNHYTGHGVDDRPDLSGTSSGSIVIAQYNFQDPQKPNCVGDPVLVQDTAGQMFVGQNLNGTLVLYIDENSGSPSAFETNQGKVRGNLAQSVVIQSNGNDLSANIVNPMLQYGINMSNELAAKAATFVPTIPQQGKLTLDTTAFDEDATIYIDADPLKGFIGRAGDLIINKKNNQTIIFNFKEEVGRAENINFAQFVVKQPNFPADGYTTQSPEGKNSKDNEYMDDIARHIVWNLNKVKGKATIDISGGIFLQPNYDSEIDVKGTSAGWIVTKGLIYNGSGEWHHVFSDMPAPNKVKIHALKTVDGGAPRSSQKFDFILEEYVNKNGSWSWESRDTKQNVTGSVEFSEIDNLAEGWHVFRILESQTLPSATNGRYLMDGTTYYAAVRVQNINEHMIASSPIYYAVFDPTGFNPDSAALTGFSGNPITIPVFNNETITKGLNISKTVKGSKGGNKEFTFEIKLWWEEANGTKTPLALDGGSAEFDISGIQGVEKILISNTAGESYSKGTITLKNGQTAVINDLPEGVHYEITETKIGEESASTTEYVDGYKSLTEKLDGVLSDYARCAFVNEYHANTKIQIAAKKELTGRELTEDEFIFELHQDSPTGPVVGGQKTNAADGTITFDVIDYIIDYSQSPAVDHMARATVKADGTREKIFTYYICEVPDPEVTDIEYAEPVEVKVKVTDDGNGCLTAYYIDDQNGQHPITEYDDEGNLTSYAYTIADKKVINKVKGGITVNKEWFRGTEQVSKNDGSIQFDLYRTTNPIAASSVPASSTYSNTITITNTTPNWVQFIGNDSISRNVEDDIEFTITTSFEDQGKYKFGNLAIFDTFSDNTEYKGKDSPVSNGNTQTLSIPVKTRTSELKIVSYYGDFTVAVSSEGENSSAALSRADLLSLVESHAAEKVNDEALEISSANSWSWSSEPLEQYNTDKEKWNYFVVERTPAGYTDTYTIDGDTITIKNTETDDKGSLTIHKEVLLNGNADTAQDERVFTVGIYRDAAATDRVVGPLTITVGANANSGSVSAGNLPFGTYYVYELGDDGNPITNGTGTINSVKYNVTQEQTYAVVNSSSTETTITNNRIPNVSLKIVKVDKNNTEILLNGAVFTLTQLDEKQERTANGTMPYMDPEVQYVSAATGSDSNGQGETIIQNMQPGYYEVKETAVPDGYVLTSDSTFYIKIDQDGNVLQLSPGNGTPETWSTSSVGFDNVLSFTAVEGENPASITVVNMPGTELPKTGGPGTALYSLLGGLMVVTAGAVLTLRRKKNKA